MVLEVFQVSKDLFTLKALLDGFTPTTRFSFRAITQKRFWFCVWFHLMVSSSEIFLEKVLSVVFIRDLKNADPIILIKTLCLQVLPGSDL